MNKLSQKLEELFGIDIRALALLRIALSTCIIIDLFDYLPYIKALFSDEGLLPRSYVLHMLPNAICLNLMSGSWVFQALLFFLLIGFAIGLLLGWRTQLCTAMVWLLMNSFHNRNYYLLGAEDKLLHVLFLFFMFLPWGACYSIDSRRKKYPIPPVRVSSMATMGYLLQISFFYTFAGFIKSHAQWTTEGTALYYTVSIHEFAKPSAQILLQHPRLMHYMTFYVLWLERYGSLFFFIPLMNTYFRLLAIVGFMLFHIGILLTMELRFFQWICLISLIGFLPTPFLNKILGPWPSSTDTALEKKFSWRPNLFRMPPYMSIFIAFFIVYILFWNLSDLKVPNFAMPKSWRWVGHTFNVYQHWGMFGPRPMTDDGWCVMPGKLKNGKIVDVYNDGKALTWKEPDSIPKLDKMYHLTLYNLNIRHKYGYFYRKPWAEYLCKEWNGSHAPEEQLMALDIYFMDREILPNYQKPIPYRQLLISHNCVDPTPHPYASVFKKEQLSPDL